MLQLLSLLLKLGKILTIAPTKSKKLVVPTLILIFLTLNVALATFYKKSDYMSLIHIKLVIAVLMDASLFIFDCLIIVVASFWKRKTWLRLNRELEKICLFASTNYYKSFVITFVSFWAVSVYDAFAWTDVMGLEFFKQYGIEIIQSYMLFYYQYLLYVVLDIILQGYKSVAILLSKGHDCPIIKIKSTLCLLKNTTEHFNEVFGWPFLLIIVYTSLQILNYFDDSFESGFLYERNEYDEVIISNVCFLILTTGGTIILIWSCDSILIEAEKLLILSQKLHRKTVIRNYQIVISDLTINYPKFYVGRFVVINRSTVYQLFSVIFTYLIVMIQFKEKLVVDAT